MGEQILTLAVLSILITAPLGAVSIMGLGPKLLKKQKNNEDEDANGQGEACEMVNVDPENDAKEDDTVRDADED